MGMKINDKRNCAGYILLSFDKLPKNCGECQLYKDNSYYDEDAFWGSGVIHYCPYCDDMFGCLVERPKGCPIVTPDNKKEKLK